ncbi:N-acetyltransferase [Prevotella sp. HUN102]|uniref:N-acetyltransferase n=1 Tax=Prevotella sp. HUN102 TaxID=1392486 RepID=UPI000566B861|nr:N-acetyltransferase [Prevotella sp. HUN102]
MIRKTRKEEIDIVLRLIDEGRKKMVAEGNVSQWVNGYPSRETIEEDIRLGNSYVVEEDGKPVATFVLMQGPDPTYAAIYEGAWLNNNPYCVIHRIASGENVRGVMRRVLEYAFRQTDTVRIDTHEDNRTMQILLTKYGFTRCGIIYLANGDPRVAFQKKV